jgi:hypothetical protein
MKKAGRIVAIAVAALLALTFLDRFVLVELLAQRVGAPLLFALIEALAVIGAGFLARRMRGGAVLDFVIGYPIFGALCFVIGLLRIDTWTMLPIVLLFAIAGGYSLWKHRAPIDRIPAVAVAVLVLGFIAAQAPPSTLDEVAYHLAVPHTWVAEGRAVDLPLISHSYFPLGIESADLPLLTFLGAVSGGIASHFLHLIAAVATTILIHRRTRDALLTAAIVTTPALALTAGWSLVDWPLLGICFALLDDDEVPPALAAGLLTKYTFIPFAIVVLAVKRRYRGIAGAVAAGSLFFIRNLILAHNPFAPFFGADAPHVSSFRELTLGSYIFDGRFIDESLGASLLAALLSSAGGLLALALIAAGVALWMLAPSARLLVPWFATAAAHANPQSRWMRVIIAVAVAGQLFLAVFFIDRSDVFSLLSAKASDAEYLTKARPSFNDIAAVDASLPPSSRTLVIGLNETYWFAHRVRGGGNFDGPRLSRYLDTPTPEGLRARLAQDGITHIAVVAESTPTAVAQKREERQTLLTPAAQRSLAQLLDRYAANVTAKGNVALFALR